MEYLLVKWVHIVSSTLLFGTGIGSAFYLLMASFRGHPAAVVFVSRLVVVADWTFTAPTAVLQPLSGLYLAKLAGLPLTTPWVFWSLVLYAIAIACWLPVVHLQMRMRDLAAQALLQRVPLPVAYWRRLRLWILLGAIALVAFLAIFYLMVVKSL